MHDDHSQIEWGDAEGKSISLATKRLSQGDLFAIKNVAEWISVKNAETDALLRTDMGKVLTRLFVLLNTALFVGVALLAAGDMALLYYKAIAPSDRIITSQVVIALIGATVVQLGLGVAAMVAYLFPKKGSGDRLREASKVVEN